MQGKKTGGRKAGTPNKVTTDLKSRIAALMDDQFDNIANDLEVLDPKDRVNAYLKLLEYVLPKQREQKIDLSMLTDEQVDELLRKALAVSERATTPLDYGKMSDAQLLAIIKSDLSDEELDARIHRLEAIKGESNETNG